jgi:predicted nucleotide-binding protein
MKTPTQLLEEYNLAKIKYTRLSKEKEKIIQEHKEYIKKLNFSIKMIEKDMKKLKNKCVSVGIL